MADLTGIPPFRMPIQSGGQAVPILTHYDQEVTRSNTFTAVPSSVTFGTGTTPSGGVGDNAPLIPGHPYEISITSSGASFLAELFIPASGTIGYGIGGFGFVPFQFYCPYGETQVKVTVTGAGTPISIRVQIRPLH